MYDMPETNPRVPSMLDRTSGYWTWGRRLGPLAGSCSGRSTMLTLCLGSTLLVPLDRAVESGILNPLSIQVVRGTLVLAFLWYILRTGWRLTFHGFDFGHALSLLCIVMVAHALVSPYPMREFYMSARAFYWILGAVVVYCLTLTGELGEHVLGKWIATLMLLGTVLTFLEALGSSSEGGHNIAYLALWCMPILLMLRTTRRTIYLVTVGAVAIILSLKRGAIVGLAVSGSVYGLAQLHPRMPARRFAATVFVFAVVVVAAAAAATYRWEDLTERFSDRSGSGRTALYAVVLEHWWEADTRHFVLGFGAGTARTYAGSAFGSDRNIAAHSDWLLFAHNYGLLGILCIMFLHMQFLHLIFRTHHVARPLFPGLLMGYTIMFLVNIYSGVLDSPVAIFLAVLIGFASASVRRVTGP